MEKWGFMEKWPFLLKEKNNKRHTRCSPSSMCRASQTHAGMSSGHMRLKWNLFGHHGKQYMWHKANTSHHPEITVLPVKHGGVSIVLLKWLLSGINKRWTSILEGGGGDKKTAMRLGWRFICQQDNDFKYTAKAIMKWFKGQHLKA